MTEIATIDWFGRWGTSVFSENTAIFPILGLANAEFWRFSSITKRMVCMLGTYDEFANIWIIHVCCVFVCFCVFLFVCLIFQVLTNRI